MTDTDTKRPTAIALVLAFAAIYLIWGSTYVAIRIGIETMPPFLMAGIRFLAAGAPLYLILRLRGEPRPATAHWGSALLLGTLMLAGGNGLVTWSEQSVPSGPAAVIIATVPLFMTSLDAWPFRRARLGLGAVVGLVLGIVGVIVLVAPAGGDLATIDPVGGAVLLLASLSWSVGSLLSRSVRLPGNSLMTAAIQMTAGGLMLLCWSTLAGEWSGFDASAVSLRSVLALVYLIVFGSIVALGSYLWLMKKTSAAAVSTYAFVNPLVAVALGWALVGETLDRRAVVASVLIVGAVICLQGSRWIGFNWRVRRESSPVCCEPVLRPADTD